MPKTLKKLTPVEQTIRDNVTQIQDSLAALTLLFDEQETFKEFDDGMAIFYEISNVSSAMIGLEAKIRKEKPTILD